MSPSCDERVVAVAPPQNASPSHCDERSHVDLRGVGKSWASPRFVRSVEWKGAPGYWCILPGTTFSGGLDPGGLIDRMKAMIFQRSSEVLTAKPIFGIPACTVPYWMRSKPDFSRSAEPSVTSLNSTSSVLPQNQTP